MYYRITEDEKAALEKALRESLRKSGPRVKWSCCECEGLKAQLEAARDQERQHEAIIQDLIADLKGTRTQLTEAQTEIKQDEEDVEMLNRALGDTNDGCVGLEKNLEATRESLSNVLDIVDGEDMQAAIMSAWIHGVVASKEVS